MRKRGLGDGRRLPVAVAVGFLVLQAWAAPAVMPSNDTYRYARTTLRVLGESAPAAQAGALRAYCAENAAWLARDQGGESVADCVRTSPHGLAPTSPRYDAVFASRIGFPIMAAPLVGVLGVNRALKATSVLLTALGGLIAYLILRLLGLRRGRAGLGQGLYYAGPIGWWGAYGLTDGPAVAISMVTLLGVVLLLRHRYRLGGALFAGSLAVGCFVRYPNFVFVALAVLAAAAVGGRGDPERRRPRLVLVALSAVGLAGIAATAYALHWPGAAESLQDTFTGHFTRPDVTDPWLRLAGLNLRYWWRWTREQVRSPWLVASAAIGAVTLVRRHRTFGRIAVAVALTGFLNQAAHPLASQGDRLLIEVWVAAVLGLPLLAAGVAQVGRHRGEPVDGRAGPGAGGDAHDVVDAERAERVAPLDERAVRLGRVEAGADRLVDLGEVAGPGRAQVGQHGQLVRDGLPAVGDVEQVAGVAELGDQRQRAPLPGPADEDRRPGPAGR
jgi:hypothetical protein